MHDNLSDKPNLPNCISKDAPQRVSLVTGQGKEFLRELAFQLAQQPGIRGAVRVEHVLGRHHRQRAAPERA